MTLARIKLYASLTSPYSRKVRVALEELQLGEDEVELIVVDPFSSSAPPEFLAANPLSRIPTLVTKKGQPLPDSSLILDYLLNKYRNRGLTPVPKSSARWPILRRAKLAEGIIDAAVAMVLEKRRPESIIFTSFLDRQAAVIRRSLQQLHVEADLLGTDKIGPVEIAAGVALAYLDFRLPWLEWRKDHDALAAWYEPFSQRQSMLKTAPPA